CAEAVCRYRPLRQQAAPLSSALILGSSSWASNLSFSRVGGEAAALGTALCKTPTSVCRATQPRPETEPGRRCGQSPNKVVDHLWIGGRGLGILGGDAGDGTKGQLSNARPVSHRHRGRAALERRLDRAKNR